ncbi:hypothetical protein DB42_BM00030 [Neochlamydia sp. EPS4]|nr:hypothetical protein DB42_BM00030 [Neochlamydia sp. EPS4]
MVVYLKNIFDVLKLFLTLQSVSIFTVTVIKWIERLILKIVKPLK